MKIRPNGNPIFFFFFIASLILDLNHFLPTDHVSSRWEICSNKITHAHRKQTKNAATNKVFIWVNLYSVGNVMQFFLPDTWILFRSAFSCVVISVPACPVPAYTSTSINPRCCIRPTLIRRFRESTTEPLNVEVFQRVNVSMITDFHS